MGIIKETIQLSEELDILHRHISKNNLAVKKKDNLGDQCVALEESIGRDNFKKLQQKYNKVNVLSGIFSFILLGTIGIIFLLDRYTDDYKSDIFLNFFIFNPVGLVITLTLSILSFGTIGYFYYLKKKLFGQVYSNLKSQLGIEEKS